MDIGMYGLHANNMEKINSHALRNQMMRYVKIYFVVMFATFMLPKRVMREELSGKVEHGKTLEDAVLLHRVSDNHAIYPYDDKENLG